MQEGKTSGGSRRKRLLGGMVSVVTAAFGAPTGFAFAFLPPRREGNPLPRSFSALRGQTAAPALTVREALDSIP